MAIRAAEPKMPLLVSAVAALALGWFISIVVWETYLAIVVVSATAVGSIAYFAMAKVGTREIFTSGGLAAGYLIAATMLVPLSWGLGLFEPWSEVSGQEGRVVLWGVLALGAFVMGMAFGWRPLPPKSQGISDLVPTRLAPLLLMADVLGLIGLVGLLNSVGGTSAALDSLDVRREFYAGAGPLIGLAFIPGVALVYHFAIPPERRTRWAWTFALVGLALYATTVFYTGQKSYALVLILMIFVAMSRRRRPPILLITLLLIVAIPVSTWYQYEYRQERAIGTSQGSIEGDSLRSFIQTSWAPFADNALDGLRTLGVAIRDAPAFRFNVKPLLAAPATTVPRAIWPDKPEASAILFSREFFPDRWSQGTGTPPSLPAELVWEFGIAGGLVAFFFVGWAVVILDRRLARSRHLLASALHSIFAVGVFLAMKAGTDSGMRMMAIFVLPLVSLYLLQRFVGISRPSVVT